MQFGRLVGQLSLIWLVENERFRCREKNCLIELFSGTLGGWVKQPQGVNLRTKKLDSNRPWAGMRPCIQNAATAGELTRTDDDVAVFIAQPDEIGAGFHQVALLGQANAQGMLQEVPPWNGAGHRCANGGDHDRMALGGDSAWQPITAEFRQHAQTVVACAFGPRQIFVKRRIGLSKVEIGAFRQPKSQFVKER